MPWINTGDMAPVGRSPVRTGVVVADSVGVGAVGVVVTLGPWVGVADAVGMGEADGPMTPDGEAVGPGPIPRTTSATMTTAAPTAASPNAGRHAARAARGAGPGEVFRG